MLILDLWVWSLDLQVKEPLVYNNGQYLQDDSLLHGLVSTSLEGLSSLFFVLVQDHSK